MARLISSAVFNITITAAMIDQYFPLPAAGGPVINDTSGVPVLESCTAIQNGYRTPFVTKGRLILPSSGPVRRVVLFLHGGGTDKDGTRLVNGLTGTYPQYIADRNEYAFVSMDLGFRSLGNRLGLTAVEVARRWALGLDTANPNIYFTPLSDRVLLWGQSMGGGTGLAYYGWRDPTKAVGDPDEFPNKAKVAGLLAGSTTLNWDVGLTGIRPDWYPQPGDYDYSMGGGDAAAGFGAAFGVPFAGLPAPLAWSGPGDRDMTMWERNVTGTGANATTRDPGRYADCNIEIVRSIGDNGGTFSRKFVAAVNSPTVNIREPFLALPSGHEIVKWGSMLEGSTVIPSGDIDSVIRAKGLWTRAEAAVTLAKMEGTPDFIPSPSFYDIPAEYADTTGSNYVESLIKAWLKDVPDGATIRGGAGATYRVFYALPFLERNLTFLGRDCEFYSPVTDNTPRLERHILTITGGNMVIQDVRVRGSNPTPGHFDVDKEFHSAVETSGVESLILSNVQTFDVWGDGFTLGPDTRRATHVMSRNVMVEDCSATNSGRNAIAPVAVEDLVVNGLTINAWGYMALDFEPGGGNHRVVRADVSDVTITPPPTGGDIELGTISFGGSGQEITDVDLHNIRMTAYPNTNQPTINVSAGTPVTNLRIGRLTNDGSDDGRGCVLYARKEVLHVRQLNAPLVFVGNDCYLNGAGGNDTDVAITADGGQAMPNAIVEYNTFRRYTKVVEPGAPLTGDRIRYNRFSGAAGTPFDQPPVGGNPVTSLVEATV